MLNRQTKRDRPRGAISSRKKLRDKRLGRARLFVSFREHATTVQRVINDLAYGRGLRIDVHSVARFEMTDDAFRRNVERRPGQLREATSLDMIDSHKPLI